MLLAAAACFAGASVQSATGFGFALVLSPALFAVLDPFEAVTALAMLGLALNVLVLFDGGRAGPVRWRALAPLLAAAVPGLVAGVILLDALSKPVLQVAVGIDVLVAVALRLRTRRPRPAPSLGSTLAAGLASGALTTSTSLSGPPLVLWLERRPVEPAELRASLAASFLALNLAGAVILLAAGGTARLAGAAVLLPLLGLTLAGYAVGGAAFRRLDPARFTAIVLALVAAAGVASLVAGLSAA
jgi:uncharacterized membrane protein YfcA